MAEKTLEELREAMVRAGKEYHEVPIQIEADVARLEAIHARLLAATRAYYDAKAEAEKKEEEK